MKSVYRLAETIGYPERVPEETASFPFLVDGGEILAVEEAGRLRLAYPLADATSASLPRLAALAAGRMLREEAVLSCGEFDSLTVGRFDRSAASGDPSNRQTVKPSNGPTVFLWQDAPADAEARVLRRLFETFCDSRDWWRERVEAPRGGDDAAARPDEMRILP